MKHADRHASAIDPRRPAVMLEPLIDLEDGMPKSLFYAASCAVLLAGCQSMSADTASAPVDDPLTSAPPITRGFDARGLSQVLLSEMAGQRGDFHRAADTGEDAEERQQKLALALPVEPADADDLAFADRQRHAVEAGGEGQPVGLEHRRRRCGALWLGELPHGGGGLAHQLRPIPPLQAPVAPASAPAPQQGLSFARKR